MGTVLSSLTLVRTAAQESYATYKCLRLSCAVNVRVRLPHRHAPLTADMARSRNAPWQCIGASHHADGHSEAGGTNGYGQDVDRCGYQEVGQWWSQYVNLDGRSHGPSCGHRSLDNTSGTWYTGMLEYEWTCKPNTRTSAGSWKRANEVHVQSADLSGQVILANYTSQLAIQDTDIALISCDSSVYAGNIGPLDVFATAQQNNARAIIWYSTVNDWCELDQYNGDYHWIYSMQSLEDTRTLMKNVNTLSGTGGYVYITLSIVDAATNGTSSSGSSSSGSSSGTKSQSSQNPLGPSPSTAVAMIILYSITGIITGLFLVIIVTGAIRAHRHPERYGPRSIMGRPRQSRARGLARAMLDTIPIVKVGGREAPKSTDVELAGTHDGTAHTSETTESEHLNPNAPRTANMMPQVSDTPADDGTTAVNGIAAAADRDVGTDDSDAQGCSICTEDFEVGQDQRVLPCDHRFHPACIDPWLLNISGTCPLCRIDLRPQNSRSSIEMDEYGNHIARDLDGMAPPLTLDGDAHRMSVRRSLMLGMMGIGRPDRLTREQRMLALREYRVTQATRRRPEGIATIAEGSEEEHGLRTRLRNAFRIRTRRTEQTNTAAPTTEATRSGPDPTGPPQPGPSG